jgi:hypothetical protein
VPPKSVSYVCQNNPANTAVADFFSTVPPTIRLERGDRTVTLWRVGAESDGLYEGQNVSLVHKGKDLTLNWPDLSTGKTDALQCKAQ